MFSYGQKTEAVLEGGHLGVRLRCDLLPNYFDTRRAVGMRQTDRRTDRRTVGEQLRLMPVTLVARHKNSSSG